MKTSFIKYAICLSIVATTLPFSAAQATNKVSGPDVTQGQLELEYRGGYDFDDATNKNAQRADKFVINYGITERWRMEAKGVDGGRAGNVDWTYAEWGNRYQLIKDGEGPVKLSVNATYKLALKSTLADKVEVAGLAAKSTGAFGHTVNVALENEVGKNARGGTKLSGGWKTQYKLSPTFNPAIEVYADFGKFGSTGATDKYQAGPAFSGKLPGGLKYDIGYLFGMHNTVPRGRLKYILGYAF